MLVKLILLGLLFTLSGLVAAENIALKLKDGSIVKGELISFVEGTYTLKSASLGLLKIESERVGAIESSINSVYGGSKASNMHNNLSDIISTLTQNKDIMAMIMSLQNSPDMEAILTDAEVMQAIQAMNFEALEDHPKIKKLMHNSQLKAIQEKVQ
jgi:hypothetical protein